jgi:polyhydroxyalkanoate synthase
MNLARAMESSGQALAAYLKPRENGEPGTSRRTNSAR